MVKGGVRGHADGCWLKITGRGQAWSALAFKWKRPKCQNWAYWRNKSGVRIQPSVTEGARMLEEEVMGF